MSTLFCRFCMHLLCVVGFRSITISVMWLLFLSLTYIDKKIMDYVVWILFTTMDCRSLNLQCLLINIKILFSNFPLWVRFFIKILLMNFFLKKLFGRILNVYFHVLLLWFYIKWNLINKSFSLLILKKKWFCAWRNTLNINIYIYKHTCI